MPEPLSPLEVDHLLGEQAQTRRADMLVLRDALDRMADALEQLGSAVGDLRPARRDSGAQRSASPSSNPPPTHPPPAIPPRAD